ncbi:ABC transporter permease [Parablautia muri]|uniref:ABC transporter permease n=1 Tax=Parablautia muri TaxID=2320879 RepID=A0A9X5BHR2_9FIRM|nr:ABC transporter permease [Parablautia muri]NBJ94305.1 ABC transporter permease [Parablautia muri]
MFRMVRTEIWKLKRYHMIWAGVLLMLLSVLLTIFSTTALDGTIWTFSHFTEQVLKNNITMIFPMCITLLAGYIIAREEKDDTLKSIMTIPVSYCHLLWGKLLVCALLSLFLGFVSAVFTVIANLIMGFPGFSVTSVLQTFVQIILNCLFLYIAVMPVIAVTARISNGHMIGTVIAFVYGYGGMFAAGNMTIANIYPITVSMGLIRYRSYDEAVHWNTALCGLSMLVVLLVSAVIVMTAKNASPIKTVKKQKKIVTKKGW